MSDLEKLRQIIERRKGRLQQIKRELTIKRRKKAELEESLNANLQAQAVIHIVAKETQDELRYNISDVVSYGLSSVFSPAPQFEIEFISRRNKIEADMFLVIDGERIDPVASSGGGSVDITSMTLRLSLGSMMKPKPRPIIVLDEPLKWLKGNDLPVKGAQMIKEFSRQLGYQVIMVSHDPELVDSADHVIEIVNNKYSKVTTY